MCSLLVRTHRGPSCGDVEPGSIRHKSVLGGIQLTVLFYQRGEGGDRLREAALLHPVHMQVVMHVSLSKQSIVSDKNTPHGLRKEGKKVIGKTQVPTTLLREH